MKQYEVNFDSQFHANGTTQYRAPVTIQAPMARIEEDGNLVFFTPGTKGAEDAGLAAFARGSWAWFRVTQSAKPTTAARARAGGKRGKR